MGSDVPPVQGSPAVPRAAAGAVFAALAAYLLFRWGLGAARLPAATPPWALILVFIVTSFSAIALPIALIAMLVRLRWTAVAGAAVLAGLGLWLGLPFLLPRPPVASYALLGALQDLGKILAASGVGLALSAAIREPNILLPAAAFAAFADFVVVYMGTVRHALSTGHGQAVVRAVSAHVPSMHRGVPSLTIGPADFLFLGFLLACAARFDLGLARNALVLAVVLGLSLVLVARVPAVPGMAPMAGAFLVVNWRRFKLTREEVASTAVVLVFAGTLFLGYFLFVYPHVK